MVWLKAEDAGEMIGVMAIDCRLWYYFPGMNDQTTVGHGPNHGVNLFFPELQEPYGHPDLVLLA